MFISQQREIESPRADASKQRPKSAPPERRQLNPSWHQLATRVQAKLRVSTPGDPYEREADEVSDRVMRMSGPLVQRTCAACAAGAAPCPKCEEEEEVRKEPPGIHRKAHHDQTDRAESSVPDEFLSTLVPVNLSIRQRARLWSRVLDAASITFEFIPIVERSSRHGR